MKVQLVLASIGCLLIGQAAAAQAVKPDEQAMLIQQLLSRVEVLEKRVQELEASRVAAVETGAVALPVNTAAEIPAGTAAGVARVEPQLSTVPPVQVQGELPVYPDLQIRGFGDVEFSATDRSDSRSGFNLGQLILHLSSPLSERVSVFGEFKMQGTPGIERMIVRYDQSDRLKFSFGRYHTPINYWNTAFHHGQWLQTTISRPEMTQFGGDFTPVHLVGGLVEGVVPAGGLNLNYNVGIGNGRGSNIAASGDFGDANNHRAWLANVFLRPDRFFGLQVGGSIYRDKITLSDGRGFREWISSAHLAWERESPEFIAEFANVNHQEIDGTGNFNSQAVYAQVGYRFNRWKPYYRFEYVHTPTSDPVFQGVSNLLGSSAGLRYDLTDFAAFKFEYRNQRRRGEPRINGAFVQTSFAF